MLLGTLLEELMRVAERLGLEVRSEPLEPRLEGRDYGRGGLCVIHGRRVILLDSRAPQLDRIAVLSSALGGFDLEDLHMAPLVRATIERRGVAIAPHPPANEASTSRVPPLAGSAWIRVGSSPSANHTSEPSSRRRDDRGRRE